MAMIECIKFHDMLAHSRPFVELQSTNAQLDRCVSLPTLVDRLTAVNASFVSFGFFEDVQIFQIDDYLVDSDCDVFIGDLSSCGSTVGPYKPSRGLLAFKGINIFERLLSGLDIHPVINYSLAGKVFNRRWLLSIIQNISCNIPVISINSFILLLFVKASKVLVSPSGLSDYAWTDKGSEVISFFSDDSLAGLDQVAGAIKSHSRYFGSLFSFRLVKSFLSELRPIQNECGIDKVFFYLRVLNDKLSTLPDLNYFLFVKSAQLLPVKTRMQLNAYKIGHCNSAFMQYSCSIPDITERTLYLDSKNDINRELPNEGRLQVTIISVVRNLLESHRIGFFEAMLGSVIEQNYPQSSIEHLVVDGNSTDGTTAYLVSLWKSERISKLISEPDTSVYNAMNKAMSLVNGDCFLFLNSDDYLAPYAISRLVRALVAESADYVFSDAWQIDEKNNKVGVVKGEIDSAWFKVPFCHQTLLCRTFPLSSHRFDESYKITMMKYALDLRSGPYKWAYVPEKLAYYRVGDGVSSAPANRSRYLEETYRVKDYSADMLSLPRELYEDLDQAWRRVTSERHYQRLVALVDEVKADMPVTELTETFCESVKRFGRYRLEQYLEKHPVDQPAPVRLALFNSHAYGGAGSAVLRLHLALRESPCIRPTLITRDMVEDRMIPDSRIIEEPEGGWNAWQDRVRTAPGATQFTVDESCIPPDMLDDIIDSHDVFSLQWTARMLSVRDIGRIVDSGKPVFITVRDMEPITGGCHYFHGCMKWRYEQCRGCPQIVTGDKRLASDAFAEKLQVLTRPNVTFVALSDISEALLRQSPLAYASPIVKIGNGFDPDTFRILDRRQARQALGLDEDFSGRYLIGMMPSFSSSVKGFDVALSALRQVEQQSAGFSEHAGLLVAGYPGDTDGLGIELPVESIGALGDAGALNLFYSACDLIVVPSREETFSNTVAEALLCGTPVFGAMAGAIPEMVTDEVNGRLFSHDWDSARIADTLLSCSEKDFSPEVCRASIADFFSQHRQVERYVELFSQAMAD